MLGKSKISNTVGVVDNKDMNKAFEVFVDSVLQTTTKNVKSSSLVTFPQTLSDPKCIDKSI